MWMWGRRRLALRRRRFVLLLGAIFTVGFAAAVALGGGLGPYLGLAPAEPPGSGQPGPGSETPSGSSEPALSAWDATLPVTGDGVAGSGVNSAPGVVVGPETRLTYRVVYSSCGCQEEQDSNPAPFVGRDLKALKAAVADYEVTLFSKDYVILTRTVDSLCPDMARYRYITITDGEVVVFYGKPPHLMVDYPTGVRVDQLRQEDKERLTAGVAVEGDEELFALLEGLSD